MIELTRFQNLRPVEWLPDEAVRQAGLTLYPDEKLSELAVSLNGAPDRETHGALMERFRKQHRAELVTGVDALSPVVRTLYDWLNFKSRPILPQDLAQVAATLNASDLPDIETQWRRYADNFLLAIEANLLSKNYCIDFQLVIRIFHLIRRALKESGGRYELAGDVTIALIEQLLSQAIILPVGAIFDRCHKKCSERNTMQLPEPAREKEGRLVCECKCDESCKRPVHHCICIRPYIGDLFLIREELARYDAGEIADIENILAGEMKVRRHRMLTRTEETLELDAETVSSSERDHGVTEKFNLQSEVKSTVDQKINLDAGVTATLKYGESITVTPHANVTANWAKSESRNLARSHAKDVVDRAVTKLQEKTRRLQISKTIREIEEHNKHSIKNDDAGAVHRAGLYYWVNKITHAQVMNYGRHMMFDMIVPELRRFSGRSTRKKWLRTMSARSRKSRISRRTSCKGAITASCWPKTASPPPRNCSRPMKRRLCNGVSAIIWASRKKGMPSAFPRTSTSRPRSRRATAPRASAMTCAALRATPSRPIPGTRWRYRYTSPIPASSPTR